MTKRNVNKLGMAFGYDGGFYYDDETFFDDPREDWPDTDVVCEIRRGLEIP